MKKLIFTIKPLPGETIAQFKLRVKKIIIDKDTAKAKKHSHDSEFNSKDLQSIQQRFHKLITEADVRSWDQPTAKKFLIDNVQNFPKITESLLNSEEPMWFAVDGMYGGFKYELRVRDDKPVLIVGSWNRVMGGSGQTHEITADCIKLIRTFDV